MIESTILTSQNLELKNLTKKCNLEAYLSWLNDSEITDYLEVRFNIPKNIIELEDFIQSVNESNNSILFGIFYKDLKIHIGNIKLTFNIEHKRAEIGLLIGDKSFWGNGYAAEAIDLVSNYTFKKYNIDKISASCYEENIASAKSFLKVGFNEEARLKDHWLKRGERQDSIILSRLNHGNN